MFEMPEILGRKLGNTHRTAGSLTEFGHWVTDSVIGLKSGRKCTLMTILDKMTHKLIALKLPGKPSQSMAYTIVALKAYFGNLFNLIFGTITTDNGSEFAALSET